MAFSLLRVFPSHLCFCDPSSWNVHPHYTSSLISFPPPVGPSGFNPNQASFVKPSVNPDHRHKVAFSPLVSRAHIHKSATAGSHGIGPIYCTVNSTGSSNVVLVSIMKLYSHLLNLGTYFPKWFKTLSPHCPPITCLPVFTFTLSSLQLGWDSHRGIQVMLLLCPKPNTALDLESNPKSDHSL